MAHALNDPHLGAGPSEDSELSQNESETASLVSEDSIMPDYEMRRGGGGTTSTLYEACNRNEALTLQRVLERGVTKEEVMELDINGRVRIHKQTETHTHTLLAHTINRNTRMCNTSLWCSSHYPPLSSKPYGPRYCTLRAEFLNLWSLGLWHDVDQSLRWLADTKSVTQVLVLM